MGVNRPRLPNWSAPHGIVLIALLLMMLVWLLAGCAPSAPTAAPQIAVAATSAVADAASDAQQVVADPMADAEHAVAQAVVPAVIAVREVLEGVLPSPVAAQGPVSSLVSPAAVDLIVGFEIISPAYYTRKLQGVVCPPRQSGPTRGIGWDDGHQTLGAIAAAWPMHPQLERILPASGQVGATKCNAYRRAYPGIRTPLDMAQRVFEDTALPAYHGLTPARSVVAGRACLRTRRAPWSPPSTTAAPP